MKNAETELWAICGAAAVLIVAGGAAVYFFAGGGVEVSPGPSAPPAVIAPLATAGPAAMEAADGRAGPSPDPNAKFPDPNAERVAELREALRSEGAEERLAAVEGLRELRDIRALRPLIETAAGDGDPNVRRAAAMAVTWLGPDPNSGMAKECRRRLGQVLDVHLSSLNWSDVAGALGRRGMVSWHAHWGTADGGGEGPWAIDAHGITLAEAWCQLVADTHPRAGWLIRRGGDGSGPLWIAAMDVIEEYVQGERRRAARHADLRRWGMGAEAGRHVLAALQRPMQGTGPWNEELPTVLAIFGQRAGVCVEPDAEALERANALRLVPARQADALAHLTAEEVLWTVLDHIEAPDEPIEFVVDGETVLVAPRSVIDRRMSEGSQWARRREDFPPPFPTEAGEADGLEEESLVPFPTQKGPWAPRVRDRRSVRQRLAVRVEGVEFSSPLLVDALAVLSGTSGVTFEPDWLALKAANATRIDPAWEAGALDGKTVEEVLREVLQRIEDPAEPVEYLLDGPGVRVAPRSDSGEREEGRGTGE